MRALLDDPPMIEHDHAIGAPHGAQPVRDDQRRAAAQQIFHRRLDRALALGVEARRRFVEDDDRRILEKDPRDRESLTLAAGQLHAALADARVEALRESLDELAARARRAPRRRSRLRSAPGRSSPGARTRCSRGSCR